MSSESGAAGTNDLSRQPLIIFEKAPRALARRPLTAFAELVSERVAGGSRFCCLLTGDAELRRLNHQFRAVDDPTDVLSFPCASPGGELGDIAISIDRARDQAHSYGHDLNAEVRVLLLHGVLHLLGHDHETDRGKMRRLETRWRKELGLPTGLIERAVKPAGPQGRRP